MSATQSQAMHACLSLNKHLILIVLGLGLGCKAIHSPEESHGTSGSASDQPLETPVPGGELTDLMRAAAKGDDHRVRAILRTTAVLDPSSHNINASGPSGYTALHYAARNGHLTTLRILLMYDAAIDPLESSGLTPLHLACLWGELDTAQELVKAGASLDDVSNEGSNALNLVKEMMSLQENNQEMLSRLSAVRSFLESHISRSS